MARYRFARPSRKALRALRRAGYITRTTHGGRTTVVGRVVRHTRRFLGMKYTVRKRVYWKKK